VGDVRAGSIKKVASAVGEGSSSASMVPRALAELQGAEHSSARMTPTPRY